MKQKDQEIADLKGRITQTEDKLARIEQLLKELKKEGN
jgi:septal ring factor EnvC (AmiA/AmiB activator)